MTPAWAGIAVRAAATTAPAAIHLTFIVLPPGPLHLGGHGPLTSAKSNRHAGPHSPEVTDPPRHPRRCQTRVVVARGQPLTSKLSLYCAHVRRPLPGQGSRPPHRRRGGPPGPRADGLAHPRPDRRHDRLGQDRPCHRAHRRGPEAGGAGHRHRPEGRPRQPAPAVRQPRCGLVRPLIDPDAARREGKDLQAAATEIAAAWKKGLAEWGLSGADVAAEKKCREATIYTPGSDAGVPLNILQSLEAPPLPFESAEEDLRDEIAGIASGLLGLLRIEADPLRSREYILLTTLIERAWRAGKGLSLETLIPAVADPPFEKLGALSLESVYPRKERNELAMALNNLLASPGFETWREGEPLDVARLLHAADGRPRLSIVYTAHLSDEERLFVTALVLDKVKTWMRQQGGTTQLRALIYMDEIYGYFPPHPANPPTKRPLLTLLKQARAQGVSVVLATQNPVDLDYKGLANIGVWFVGKLQTAQDRERLREGLTGAGMAPAAIDTMLDATRKRVFLLHDVHRAAPVLLHSRWALSYLQEQLTREEIGRLMAGDEAKAARRTPAA